MVIVVLELQIIAFSGFMLDLSITLMTPFPEHVRHAIDIAVQIRIYARLQDTLSMDSAWLYHKQLGRHAARCHYQILVAS